jgi:hypothetical protein
VVGGDGIEPPTSSMSSWRCALTLSHRHPLSRPTPLSGLAGLHAWLSLHDKKRVPRAVGATFKNPSYAKREAFQTIGSC